MSQTKLKGEASVLYSGGTDSTLAAVRMLEGHAKVTLLTFNPSFILFVRKSRKHVGELQRVFGADRVCHRIIKNSRFFKRVVLGNFVRDLADYGPNLAVQLCHGCRLGMHARAIIYNLEHGIKYIADGSIRKQSVIPEQMDYILARNRGLFAEFGIEHCSPIYDETRSDLVLDKLGISTTKKLKREFVVFGTQATCPFGVPADVYAKLFYAFMGRWRELECNLYNKQKHRVVRQLVTEHFETEGVALDPLVQRLKEIDAD